MLQWGIRSQKGVPTVKKKPPLPPPLELTVTGYDAYGAGVSRLPDGMTVFVTGALKGEKCLVQLDKVGRLSLIHI